jgi:hypothetical protein
MPELKTNPLHDHPESWLPSFDLHEENGELVFHADLSGFASEELEISLDGSELIVLAEGENGQGGPVCYSRLLLPFAPGTLGTVSRHGHQDLEIRISIPPEGERS